MFSSGLDSLGLEMLASCTGRPLSRDDPISKLSGPCLVDLLLPRSFSCPGFLHYKFLVSQTAGPSG